MVTWTYAIVARDEQHEYRISGCPGAFVIRVSARQTNRTLWRMNCLPSIEAAQQAIEQWRQANKEPASHENGLE